MSNKDKENEEIMLYGHRLPVADPAWCSECRGSIIQGMHNVVRINETPEKIVGLNGELLGTKGEFKPKAFFHAGCFQKIAESRKIPGRIECKYCGILSMAKTLKDGRKVKDICKCSCHDGADYCSLLVN